MPTIRVRLVNLTFQHARPRLQIQFDYLRNSIVLPGAWSREIIRDLEPGAVDSLMAMADKIVRSREQRAWDSLPMVRDIAIRHIDAHRYKAENYGVAIAYARLGADGEPLEGFDGATMFRCIEGQYEWPGGDTNEGLSAELPAVAQAIFDWAESYVEENIVNKEAAQSGKA